MSACQWLDVTDCLLVVAWDDRLFESTLHSIGGRVLRTNIFVIA